MRPCRGLLALIVLASAARGVEIYPVKGDPIKGDLVSITDKEIVYKEGDKKVTKPIKEVLKIEYRDVGKPAAGATYVFFAAYLPQGSWAAEVGPNRALLVNAVEGLEAVGAPLRHVTLITGAKYYGVHLGPSAAPAAETEPRHLGPNFYYDQEDYLRSRTDAAWRWTNLVPTHLTGFAAGNPMNLALSIAVYASLVRAAGLRLNFPGSAAAFGAPTRGPSSHHRSVGHRLPTVRRPVGRRIAGAAADQPVRGWPAPPPRRLRRMPQAKRVVVAVES